LIIRSQDKTRVVIADEIHYNDSLGFINFYCGDFEIACYHSHYKGDKEFELWLQSNVIKCNKLLDDIQEHLAMKDSYNYVYQMPKDI